MAKRKIPTNMQPWKANINGEEYEYQSGITADVPDEVAALIDFIDASAPKRDPKAAQRAIEDEVEQIVKDNFAGGVGYEEPAEVVMLPETSFEIVTVGPETIIKDSFPSTFEISKEYTVTFDGVANTCTAIDYDGTGALTNTSWADVVAGNGWIILAGEGSVILQTLDPSLAGTHTISISGKTLVVRKIDSKYIPNEPETSSAPSVVYFDPSNSSGKIYNDSELTSEIPPTELAQKLLGGIVLAHAYNEYIVIPHFMTYENSTGVIGVAVTFTFNETAFNLQNGSTGGGIS